MFIRKFSCFLGPKVIKYSQTQKGNGMQVKRTVVTGLIYSNIQSVHLDKHIVVVARYLRGQACPLHSSADLLLLLLSEQIGPLAPTQFLPLKPENKIKQAIFSGLGYWRNPKI